MTQAHRPAIRAVLLAAWFAFFHPAPALAQAVLVTELQGPATRASAAREHPAAVLETLAAGDRLRIPAKSTATVFVPGEAALYVVPGPAEIAVTPKQGLRAVSGRLPAPRHLHEAYRNLKVDTTNVAQGGLVLRGGDEDISLVSPEGVVEAAAARRFRWVAARSLAVRFELATAEGEPVFRSEAATGEVSLPEAITLLPGGRYTWGVFSPSAPDAPLDWTDFRVADEATVVPGAPAPSASRSERALYAAWLQAKGLPRASLRVLAAVRP